MYRSLFARSCACFALLAALAACAPGTQPPPIPTLIELPTLTPTVPATEIAAALSPSIAPSETLVTDTPTPPPSETPAPTATVTPSLTPLLPNTATDTFTPTATFTFTPSLTITNTSTPTETPDIGLLGELARMGEQATILPLEQRIPAPTLTALAIAALSLQPTPIPAALPGIGSAPTPVIPVACLYPPPAGVALLLAADPALQNQLGCAVGAPPITELVSTAAQFFERGAMVYVAGAPGAIYALYSDGRFRRYDDTFISGVDPDSGGEMPPAELTEPIRGFGKVWRNNPEVRGLLGWARGSEMGNTSSLQVFSSGRVIYLPQLSASVALVEDPGGYSGTWRVIAGAF